MDEGLFCRLLPVFKKTRLVHLQGWGDPFTHPQFFSFARLAKSAGCQVGTTSNGMLLNEQLCEQLVNENIDRIGFSLAGTGAENDQYRCGTRIEKVLSVIENIHRIKQRVGAEFPHIHIAYLLLKSGIKTVDRLPDLLRERGVSQVVINTMDTIGSPSLKQEAIFPDDAKEMDVLHQQLEEVIEAGRDVGLDIYYRLPSYIKKQEDRRPLENETKFATTAPQMCSENIQRAAFIGVTGNVSPCVFVNLPLTAPLPAPTGFIARIYRSLVYGNIAATRFEKIWHSQPYSSFRKAHHFSAIGPECQWCTKFSG